MNNLFTSKGRVILFLFLVFQFGLKMQASANTRMVCDTDTTKKSAINSQTIKTDTTLVLKAGSTISTIVKNSDTTLIIDGVVTTLPKKSDVKADPATADGNADSLNAAKKSHGLVEVKSNDPSTIDITAPPADGTVQVKNTENAPPANVTIGSVPTDGIIQVKDAATMSADSAAQAKAKDATNSEQALNGQTQTDSTKALKANAGAAGSPDAATDAAGAAAAGTTPGTTSTSGQPINGMIQVKNVDSTAVSKGDTTLAKKGDTSLMRRPDTTAMQTDSADSTAVKAKGYYLEVGGPGLAISANYDARFNKTRDGWGYRIGLGGFIAGANKVITIPFQVNYLIGQHSSMLEFGAGTTFLSSTGDSKGKTWAFDKITGFIATGSIGYRYQPEHKGINFRLAFVPILYDEGVIPAGGISVGYTFK